MLDSGVETVAEAVLRVGASAISSRVELQVSGNANGNGNGKGMSLEAVGRSAINCAFPLFCAGPGRRCAGSLSGLEAG